MYTDEVRVRLGPRSSHSKRHGGSFHRTFFFSDGMLVNVFFYSKNTRCQLRRKRSCVLILSKCGDGSVGEGEEGKKTKTTPDVGGKSVSEKSQVTHTRKNPFEKLSSKQTKYFVCVVDKRTGRNGPRVVDTRTGRNGLSSSSGDVTFLLTTILTHGNIYATGTHQYLSLEHTNI
jgi:hypothetical protein